MESVLITGSNRGIGLALVEAYLQQGKQHVIATCRNPDSASTLHQLAKKYPDHISIVKLDVSDSASIQSAVDAVQKIAGKLEVLINNAGVYPNEAISRTFGQLEAEAVAHVLTTNAVSAVMVTQSFVSLLRAAENPRVVMISSQMGSITRASSSGIAYRMSKAAMNMGAKVIAQNLRSSGITVITTHPGHVATDMGGSGAPVQPRESANGLVSIINDLEISQSGSYYSYNGEEIPW